MSEPPPLKAILKDLDLLERAVLVRRFGLDGRHVRTYREIGEELDRTPSQVREIEARALAQARRRHA